MAVEEFFNSLELELTGWEVSEGVEVLGDGHEYKVPKQLRIKQLLCHRVAIRTVGKRRAIALGGMEDERVRSP